MSSPVYAQIYAVVARVPPGWVVTYGQIARYLGMPHGARTVGWAMQHCPGHLPWHRVVNSRGEISSRGPSVGSPEQRARLEEEGVQFDRAGRIDLERFGWDGI